MKHPATTRNLITVRHLALALISELRAQAYGWIERLRPLHPITEAAVTIDLENVMSLDDLHGHGAADHAARLMARALEEETGPDDFVARTGPTTFSVVVRNANRAQAAELVARVQIRFDELLHDAGYECALSLGESPLDNAPEVDEFLERTPLPRITVLPNSALYLN